jgi:hypothetical protein
VVEHCLIEIRADVDESAVTIRSEVAQDIGLPGRPPTNPRSGARPVPEYRYAQRPIGVAQL